MLRKEHTRALYFVKFDINLFKKKEKDRMIVTCNVIELYTMYFIMYVPIIHCYKRVQEMSISQYMGFI